MALCHFRYMIRFTIILILAPAFTATVLSTLLENYEKEVPPLINGQTTITHDMSITSFSEVEEINLSYKQVVVEHYIWEDQRLAYENNTNIDDLYKSTFLYLNPVIDDIWKPETSFTDMADHEWKDRSIILYPNGTLFYTTYRWIVLQWDMNFERLPFDEHEWRFNVYLVNENSDVAILQQNNWTIYTEANEEDTSFVPQNLLSDNVFDIEIKKAQQEDVYLEYSQQYHSGLKYQLNFDRRPNFFIMSYVFTSFLTIFLAYSSFWIDKAAIPARVSLPITTVLIMLSLMARANKNIPNVAYITWMSKFFLGMLAFCAFSLVQYGALNFWVTRYLQRRKEINEQINKLRKKTQKDEDKYLQAQRVKANIWSDSIDEIEIEHEINVVSPKEDKQEDVKFSSIKNNAQNQGLDESNNEVHDKISSFGHHSAFELDDEEEKTPPSQRFEKDENSDTPSPERRVDNKGNLMPKYYKRSDPLNIMSKESSENHNSRHVKISISSFSPVTKKVHTMNQNKLDLKLKNSEIEESKMSLRSENALENNNRPVMQRQDNIIKRRNSLQLSSSSPVSSSSFSSHSSEYDDDVLPLPKFTERRRSRSHIYDSGKAEKVIDQACSSLNKSHNILATILNMTKERRSTNVLENNHKDSIVKRDPEAYKTYVDQLRSVLKNENEDERLDFRSLRRIKKIIKLENSYWFHFWYFMYDQADYYTRIYFPICFLFFLGYIFASLAKHNWVYLTVLILEIFILIGIVSFNIAYECHLKQKSIKAKESKKS